MTPSNNVHFFNEDVELPNFDLIKATTWLSDICSEYNYKIVTLNYIFCSDEYLLNINREYLNHDYYTDIITFDQSEEELTIEGDIFISVERVEDNANNLSINFNTELLRVLAHGLLHLLGFKDKSTEESTIMRNKEDDCINMWNKSN